MSRGHRTKTSKSSPIVLNKVWSRFRATEETEAFYQAGGVGNQHHLAPAFMIPHIDPFIETVEHRSWFLGEWVDLCTLVWETLECDCGVVINPDCKHRPRGIQNVRNHF